MRTLKMCKLLSMFSYETVPKADDKCQKCNEHRFDLNFVFTTLMHRNEMTPCICYR